MASLPSSDDSFWHRSSSTWYPNMTSSHYSSQQLPRLPRAPESSLSDSWISSSASDHDLVCEPKSHSSFSNKLDRQDQTCPDGGLEAWLVIVGSAFLLFATFGFQTSIGLFQLHLSLYQLSAYSATEVGWIPSLFIFSSLIFMFYAGALFDRYGARYLLGVGSTGYFITFFLLARCTRYWHFILCLGLLGGLSSGAIITVAQGVIGHWFRKKHGMASGLAMIGAALGGIVFPMILNPLLENVGWVWAMQALGFIMGGCLVVGNVMCKSRMRATCTSTKIDVRCFLDSRFAWLTAGVFGFELLLISGVGLIPTYAFNVGYGKLSGYFLVMTMSIGSTCGRLIPSYYCDDIGRFNTLLITSVVTLLGMLVLWLPFGEKSITSLYFFVILYGFGTGSFVSLSMACVGQICSGRDIRRWIVALDSAVSVATLISIPASSAFLHLGGRVLIGFLISMLTLSIAALCVARVLSLGGKWLWRAKI